MRKLLVLTAVSLMFMSFAGTAATPSLIQNEYDFAHAAADHGVRDGFLMYLDEQAITLAPQPANAYEIYTNRKPSSTKLSWYPSYALLSSSGDFGVDTGPWTAIWTQDGKQQDAHGDWLTVWHLTKQGRWRILFDGGVDHAAPPRPPAALGKTAKVMRLPKGPVADMDEVHASLERAETLFSNTFIESSPHSAYAGQAADDIRLLREDSPTVQGKSGVLASMSIQPGNVQWVPGGGAVAVSGDLGYLYGVTYKAKDDEHKTPLGSYMHVWRRDAGDWKLLIDLELPVPPPQGK